MCLFDAGLCMGHLIDLAHLTAKISFLLPFSNIKSSRPDLCETN